jgi:WD40 repeat protein
MAGLVKWARDNQHEAEDAGERAYQAQLESERYAATLELKYDELEAQNAKIMALTPGKQIPGLTRALGALAGAGQANQPVDREPSPHAGRSPSPGDVDGRAHSRTLEAGIFAATRSLHDVWELPGHDDNIIDVDFAPDGRLFASASRDDRVLVWSADAPHQRRAVLSAHKADVTHVEFSRTSDRLLTVGDDLAAFIWDVADLERGKALDPGCPVRAARLAPDGRTAALACDTEVCLWSLGDDEQVWLEFEGQVELLEWAPTGTHLLATSGSNLALATLRNSEVMALAGHREPLTAIAFSPDGSKIVSGDAGGVARLWASPAGTQLSTLDDAHGQIERAVFSGDGERLVIVDATPTPTLWQLDGELGKTRLLGHGAQVADAAFSRDGELLATVGYDQTLRLWAASSGAARSVLEAPNTPLLVAFSPTGDEIVTGELTGASKPMVRVWDVESSTRRVVVRGAQQVASVALSGDGGRAALAEAQHIRIWDTHTGLELRELGHADVMQIEMSASGRKLAARDATRWRVWDIDRGTELMELPGYVSAVTFAGVDELLVTADLADRVGLWTSLAEQGPPEDVERNYYASLVVSPTGMLAGARRKGRVSLWESVSGPSMGDFDEVANYVIDELAFSPSGRWLAITSQQKMVWLLDVNNLERRTLQTDNPIVGAVAFSPDERHLLVGNGTAVTLWSIDADQPEVIATIGQHERSVEAAAYSADGRSVVTVGKDGLVISWPTTAEDRRALACQLVAHSPVAYRDALDSCR